MKHLTLDHMFLVVNAPLTHWAKSIIKIHLFDILLYTSNCVTSEGKQERKLCAGEFFLKDISVMSLNIRIFEYSNKMALKYYSYLYSCHFPSTNIFGYSFVDFWTTEYIQIFVCKFLKIRIYLIICSEPHSNICASIFNEQ